MIYLQCKVVKHLRLYVCTIVFKRFDNTVVQVLIGFSLKIKKNVSLSIYPRPSTRGMIKMVYTIFTVFNQTFVIITGKGKKRTVLPHTSSVLRSLTGHCRWIQFIGVVYIYNLILRIEINKNLIVTFSITITDGIFSYYFAGLCNTIFNVKTYTSWLVCNLLLTSYKVCYSWKVLVSRKNAIHRRVVFPRVTMRRLTDKLKNQGSLRKSFFNCS